MKSLILHLHHFRTRLLRRPWKRAMLDVSHLCCGDCSQTLPTSQILLEKVRRQAIAISYFSCLKHKRMPTVMIANACRGDATDIRVVQCKKSYLRRIRRWRCRLDLSFQPFYSLHYRRSSGWGWIQGAWLWSMCHLFRLTVCPRQFGWKWNLLCL